MRARRTSPLRSTPARRRRCGATASCRREPSAHTSAIIACIRTPAWRPTTAPIRTSVRTPTGTASRVESLAEKGDFDANDVAERWVKWMKRDGRGIGLTTQRALRLIERGTEPFEAGRLAHNPRAASNGAVMRCIPVALRYHDNVDRLVRVSTQQAAITHADERCTWGAAAGNLAARELLHENQHFVEEGLYRLQGAPRMLVEAIRRVPWEQETDLPISRAR